MAKQANKLTKLLKLLIAGIKVRAKFVSECREPGGRLPPRARNSINTD